MRLPGGAAPRWRRRLRHSGGQLPPPSLAWGNSSETLGLAAWNQKKPRQVGRAASVGQAIHRPAGGLKNPQSVLERLASDPPRSQPTRQTRPWAPRPAVEIKRGGRRPTPWLQCWRGRLCSRAGGGWYGVERGVDAISHPSPPQVHIHPSSPHYPSNPSAPPPASAMSSAVRHQRQEWHDAARRAALIACEPLPVPPVSFPLPHPASSRRGHAPFRPPAPAPPQRAGHWAVAHGSASRWPCQANPNPGTKPGCVRHPTRRQEKEGGGGEGGGGCARLAPPDRGCRQREGDVPGEFHLPPPP